MTTVLIVDDEPNIIALSQLYFEREGYTVVTAQDGAAALVQAEAHTPDLILLDIMLPRLDGWEVCRRLRGQGNRVPIILLTARDDDVDKIVGLEIGADDYVTKPFNPREVVARAKALLRRQAWEQPAAAPAPALRLQQGALLLDEVRREASVNGQLLTLRPREWDLLLMLMRHPGEVLSRDQLLDQVWGFEYYGDTRTVDVHVAALREKLRATGDPSVAIETVWGVGYKLVVT